MDSSDKPFNLYEHAKAANLDELVTLSNNEDENWRAAIASEGNLTEALFRKLAQDKSVLVRCALASRMDTPHDILAVLSKDSEWEVRWAVVNCNNSTLEILRPFLDDQNELIRRDAQEHMNYLQKHQN